MSDPVTLRALLGDYAGTRALRRGEVPSSLVGLRGLQAPSATASADR